MRIYFQAAPEWLLKQNRITQRQWKSRKRRDLRALEKALENYRLGCAYTPGHAAIDGLDAVIKIMRQTHSVKAWGR